MFNFFFKTKSKPESQYKAERLSAFGFKTYNDYLTSDVWKKKKIKFYKSSYCSKTNGTPSCSVCGSISKPNVHHLTYKHICREKLEDLLLLCNSCHNLTHDVLKTKLNPKYNLSNAHKLAKKVRNSKRLKLKLFDLLYS
tara:strand:+ start:1142 stop:1558 length:417 start_codon:yes stop_codon:yes gene_type:complete